MEHHDDMVQDQIKSLDKSILYNQFLEQQRAENDAAMAQILSTKIGREAYSRQFNIPLEQLEGENREYSMLGAIDNFYSEYEEPNQQFQNMNEWY